MSDTYKNKTWIFLSTFEVPGMTNNTRKRNIHVNGHSLIFYVLCSSTARFPNVLNKKQTLNYYYVIIFIFSTYFVL